MLCPEQQIGHIRGDSAQKNSSSYFWKLGSLSVRYNTKKYDNMQTKHILNCKIGIIKHGLG